MLLHKNFAKHLTKTFRGLNCSLLPLYLGCIKQAIILYPYFVCECTEPF